MHPSSQLESIFFAALERTAPEERSAYLAEHCAGDESLRRRIERMLEAQAASFLQSPPDELVATAYLSLSEGVGTQIGPYKLLQQIGEGGMGVVFMAEQSRPVQRTVALKIIKPGMDTRQVIARFEAERQALALMDHPNISKVFDAGTTDTGRPYFVMELVKGVPITKYCDEKHLPLRERLELFVSVCQAVQHAHQKGIIHRDLKPSNVMVALYDGRPVPKIIDFGVVKATGPKLTDRTMFTEFGAVIGTLEYMSPEQAELNQLDIDTRSDIYALGVLLYELLTGETPFDRKRLHSEAFQEVLRIIREEEPPTPSIRLTTLAQHAASTVSAQRNSDPERLSLLVRGELDWIVMKCLDKDRNRRYDSANALAQDVERYLNDEPVLACPPSVTYRLGKFIRRHKAALFTAAALSGVILLALVGLAVGSLLIWQANNEARRLTYFQRVALAEREWSANNLKRTDELLALCPVDLRGWEWNFVKRLRGRQLPPLQHDGTVADFAVSPDGTQIVSLDWSGNIHWWDSATGRETRPPVQGHGSLGGVVSDLIFSRDGRSFATTGWDDVKVWDATSGAQLHAWKAPAKSAIHGLAFDSAGRLLACVCTQLGGKDNASVWDPVMGQKRFELSDAQLSVLDIAVSPDDKVLAVACVDATVRLVDSQSGEAIRTLRGDRPFWCVSFSPNGKLVAAGTGGEGEQDSGTVRIWDVASGLERPTLTGHGAQCVAFSPDGQRLATGGSDQAVKIWDIHSGQEILTLRGHTDFVQGICFTPDGCRLVSSGERSIRIWDGRPWSDSERFGDDVVTLRGHTDSVNVVAFRPHAEELATASTDGTIKIWSTQTWRELRSLRTQFEQVSAFSFNSNGDRLAVSGTQANQSTPVVIIDAEAGDELKRLDELSGDQVIAFAANGKQLAIGNENGFATIFDVATHAAIGRFQAPGRYLYGVRFSPDDRLLAACQDDKITIWNIASGREIDGSPLRHRGFIYGLAFSPDGQFLASGGWDRIIRVWDTSTWKQVQAVIDADAATQAVAFSPDGKHLAWGATDSAVKLWHRDTGELHTLRGHLGNVRSVAFSPDGNWLASASEDGTAKIWKLPHDETTP